MGKEGRKELRKELRKEGRKEGKNDRWEGVDGSMVMSGVSTYCSLI